MTFLLSTRFKIFFTAFVLICSLPVKSTFAFPAMSNQDYINFINPYLTELSSHVDELYNLDSELNSDEFQQAKSDSEKSDVMHQLYLTKRDKILARLVRKNMISKVFSGIILGSILLAGGVFTYKKGFLSGGNIAGIGAAGIGAAGASLFTSIALQIYGIYNSVIGMSRLHASGLKGIYIPIEDSEELFARNYHKLKRYPSLLSIVVEKLKLLRRSSVDSLHAYKHFVESVTSLPLVERGTWLDMEIFENKFKYFPDVIRKKLLSLAKRQVFEHRLGKKVQNFPIYFQGIPGVGKTYAAQALAEATHVSLGQVVLDGATIEEIIGTPFNPNGTGNPGRLLTAIAAGSTDAMTGVSYSDNILFIDEFDRLLNANDPASKAILSFMLKILDPNNKTFFSPYLGTHIDLPKTIILAGNNEINDEALKNRFEIIRFNGYEKNELESIAKNSIVAKYCTIYDFEKNCLNDEEIGSISNHIATSSDLGLRTAEKFIMSLVSEKAYISFRDLILNPPPEAI